MAKINNIQPTRPTNIKTTKVILDSAPKLGVIPSVIPTVPKAENTSKIISSKVEELI